MFLGLVATSSAPVSVVAIWTTGLYALSLGFLQQYILLKTKLKAPISVTPNNVPKMIPTIAPVLKDEEPSEGNTPSGIQVAFAATTPRPVISMEV